MQTANSRTLMISNSTNSLAESPKSVNHYFHTSDKEA